MKYLTLNRIFVAYVAIFTGVITGILPREVIVYVTAFLMAWVALAPLEDGVLFFVRSVPLFVAIPLTASYDNLNMWRPLALVLIVRLLLQRETWTEIKKLAALRHHPIFRRLLILFILAGLSLIGAAYIKVGIIRIIYFANLLMVPMVLWMLLKRGTLTTQQVIKSIAIPTMIVIVVGYIQLASTYLIDIYQFMRVWGEGVQLRQFGTQWSYIAIHLGNTWLAYYGPQLSLRVFSLFTDSHTFPLYVLLGLPALLALALDPILAVVDRGVKAMARTRARMGILWVPAALLMIILSGTRGIWAASIGVVVIAIGLAWFMKWKSVDTLHRSIFKYISLYLLVFFFLFAVAWPIFISPQFLLGNGDWGLLGNRVKSIVDFGETSNALRLKIWHASLVSIAHHPLLGVGIGNFPVVLDQNIALSKAGSTAHNVYLHVAAEMGIPAALEFVVLLGGILFTAWRWFRAASGRELVYAAASLLTIPWVLIYLLTDAALFDERAFLAFGITAALILAHE